MKGSLMSKLKTHKALVKRFRVSKNGKVKRRHAGKNHLNSGLSPKRRRKLRHQTEVSGAFAAKIKRALGHAR
jgi:large subunit ribosomal protein L35